MKGCRFIHGDPRQPGWKWCGMPTLPERPYCAEHWRLTHIPRGTPDERHECAKLNVLAGSSAGRRAESAHYIQQFDVPNHGASRSDGRRPAHRHAA